MNPLIILDVPFGGYGIIKSLKKYDIPLYGFYRKNDTWSEIQTKLCSLFPYENDEDILSVLYDIKDRTDETPVLIFTNDNQVKFFVRNYDKLAGYFLFNMPSVESINTFMYKDKFASFAKAHGLKLPWTISLTKDEDFHNVEYPCFVKPAGNWAHAYKGYVCNNPNEAKALLQYGSDLIAQEWVPGGSKNILSTFLYYDTSGRCRACITGQKIREWPTVAGSGSCLGVVQNKEMERQSQLIFEKNQYRGIGSFEMKKHEITGELYAIEPTVGRVDVGSFFTVINGINIPAMYYFDVIGNTIPNFKQKRIPQYWIHELMDIQSVLVNLKQNPKQALEVIKTYLNSQFHLLNPKDMLPFWLFFKDKILKIR